MRSTAARGEIIIRRPLAQPSQRRGDRRHIEQRMEGAQAVIADFFRRDALRLPSYTHQLPRPQWRNDNVSRLDPHAIRHAIIERAECSVQGNNTDAG
jgi:hypothetical protein